MKVEVKIYEEIKEPYVIIYTNSITSEIQKIISTLEEGINIITVHDGDKILILQKEEIYMVRIEMSEVVVHCKDKKYKSKKRLYEIGEQLGSGFIQISKSAFVNSKEIQCVEPYFNGMMSLKLKNGTSEYISRKYLPEFKKYLGI
ncbi:LytTR family transcriptional regulator [Paraclostridium bifermentans]|uniref:LytTR family transcriptional regulator n=1 Tax=Paraclostridium bifermentans TaxID=1490 RepID=A0A5P3XFQ9_PARBF|nr:LytTR family DNA-binding domain-containing protein [Paraclostridium bifermentans]QEZ69156.1 LytTR family transcriptional regulator [Paraclostridium bifermentans]